MSEPDDMKTIVTLLGNLIEKIEAIEENVEKLGRKVVEGHRAIDSNTAKSVEELKEFRSSMNSTGERFNEWVNKLDKKDREHHGDLDAWTKDVSIKLTQLGMKIDNKKIKLF